MRSARLQTGRSNRERLYERPRVSRRAPLRTALLDDGVNTVPPSRTRSELLALRRRRNEAHMSYDIDGDGDVSQEDYILAKKYDANGNGILEADEQRLARRGVALSFFRDHAHDSHLYGFNPEYDATTLAEADNFAVTFRNLKRRERRLWNSGSAHLKQVLTSHPPARHHFYCDKFDTTAWNDHGANPRRTGVIVQGSRLDLFQRRTIDNNDVCAHKLAVADSRRPKSNHSRVSLITNIAIENS